MKTTMTLEKWYGSSLRIPSFHHWSYASFAASCLGVVNSVVQNKLDKKIVVRFQDIPTAYADVESGIIAINSKFVEGNFGKGIQKDSSTTIAAIMGIQVHEAAHFAYSPKDLKPYVDHIQKKSKCAYSEQVAATVGNIIEDIYIEAEIDKQIPNLSWTLNVINEILFSENEEVDRCVRASHINGAPVNVDDLSAVLDVLILAKTRDTVNVQSWILELFNMVKGASQLSKFSERVGLSLQVYNRLMENINANQLPSNSNSPLESEGTGQAEAIGKLEKCKEDSFGVTSQSGFDKVMKHSKVQKMDMNPTISGVVEALLDELTGKDVILIQDELGVIGEPTNLFIEEVMGFDGDMLVDSRYSRLAELARQQAVANRPYGLDSNRGHTIRKLYRIATDQKIFAEPVDFKTLKPMQVIILIDMSGSMRMSVVEGTYHQRLLAANQAALGAAIALTEARCDVAVYGHTADVTTSNCVNIYRAKAFNEPISILSSRLSYGQNKCFAQVNRDGYALSYVAKKFTDGRKRNLIIVFSDGLPYGTGYTGYEAIEHCHAVVERLHSQRIDVLSISIDFSAKDANDRIYGENNNVFNPDPNVIEDVIRKILHAN